MYNHDTFQKCKSVAEQVFLFMRNTQLHHREEQKTAECHWEYRNGSLYFFGKHTKGKLEVSVVPYVVGAPKKETKSPMKVIGRKTDGMDTREVSNFTANPVVSTVEFSTETGMEQTSSESNSIDAGVELRAMLRLGNEMSPVGAEFEATASLHTNWTKSTEFSTSTTKSVSQEVELTVPANSTFVVERERFVTSLEQTIVKVGDVNYAVRLWCTHGDYMEACEMPMQGNDINPGMKLYIAANNLKELKAILTGRAGMSSMADQKWLSYNLANCNHAWAFGRWDALRGAQMEIKHTNKFAGASSGSFTVRDKKVTPTE